MKLNHNESTNIFDIFSYLVIAFFFVLLSWSASVPWLPKWQTSLSSAHAITAGKHFAEDGFITCKFLPVWQPGKLYDEYYTHYPPLSDLLNGVIRKLGFDSLFSFRFPHIIFATMALLFWFLFVKNLYNSKAAFLCVLLLAILPENYIGAYSPQAFSLDQFFRFAALYLVYLLFNVEEINKKRISFLLWLVMFFQSINSLEYIIYLQLYIWLHAVFFKVPNKKKLIWFFSAPGLGIFLHLLQNIWALGVSGLVWDIVKTFNFRVGLESVRHSEKLLKSFKMYFWNFMGIAGIEKSIYLVILSTVIVIISIFELKKYYKIKKFLYYLFIFFVCEVNWFLLFPEHALVHIQDIKFLFPSITLLIGVLFYVNIESLKGLLNSRKIFALMKTLVILCFFLTLYGYKIYSLAETVEYNFTTPVPPYKFRGLKKLIPDDAICLTSFFTYDACYMRFYLDRRTYAARISQLDRVLASLEKEPFYNKDNLYYIYHRNIEKADFKDDNLFLELIEKKIIIRNYADRKPSDYVYFNNNITNEDQLKKRLVQIGVSDIEHILNLWRKSFQDAPEKAEAPLLFKS
jgi:hypothetical protein